MPHDLTITPRASIALASLTLLFAGHALAEATSFSTGAAPAPPVNAYALPIRDPQGAPINYTKDEIAAAAQRMGLDPATAPSALSPSLGTAPLNDLQPAGSTLTPTAVATPTPTPTPGFVPTTTQPVRPFWEYAVFGSNIGSAGILVNPSASGGAPEIIIGGGTYWQVIRYNSTTGNYDTVFVSRVYTSTKQSAGTFVGIARIAIGNVVGDSAQELVVMLTDGRIYLYDLATREELGIIYTGLGSGYPGLQALALADLDGTGHDELIVTTSSDLYVFDGAGNQLWKVAGAGGSDVVVGQMDNDPGMEIATASGYVIDATTHLVQWTYKASSGGFGIRLKLAPLSGASYQQLIAAQAWDYVYSYDVAKQIPLWSISTFNNSTLQTADIDNDGIPEVLVGDAQWGNVHAYDLLTQKEKWHTSLNNYNITNVTVADVDADGNVDLLWGTGSGIDGSHLYVADTTGARSIKWQTVDLTGPLLGPVIGDVDGDGRDELIICSSGSNGGYGGARVVVFDLETLALRTISAPLSTTGFSNSVRDLKLRDVDGDGLLDIVIANGGLAVYGFDWANNFPLLWATASSYSPQYNLVEVADLNGSGRESLVAAGTESGSTSGAYVYIFDYPSNTYAWRSVALAGTSAPAALQVTDLDGNGSKEIAALDSGSNLYTFDGSSRTLANLQQQTNATVLSSDASNLILGDRSGVAHFWRYVAASYAEQFTRQVSNTTIDGLSVLADSGLWVGASGTLSVLPAPLYPSADWQSPAFDSQFGRFVASDYRQGERHVFSSSAHAVAGFVYQSSAPAPSPTPSPAPHLRPTPTPSPTPTPTPTPFPAPTSTPTATPMPTPTATASASATVTPSPSATATATPTATASPTATPTPTPAAQSQNISTRLNVLTGDNVMIGGFIVTGSSPKRVIVRAIGPSMGIPAALADPTLELHMADGTIVTNDDWKIDDATGQSQESDVRSTQVPPPDEHESALVLTLNPGSYTAIVSGKNGGTGIGLVEVYDVGDAGSTLANISTRGFVDTGDNVMIGGFIIGPSDMMPSRIAVRAIGPSTGVPGALQDPVLELHDENGGVIATNDNWQDDASAADIQTAQLAPADPRESAMIRTLNPGKYTAVVRGANSTTGVGLVEVYNLR